MKRKEKTQTIDLNDLKIDYAEDESMFTQEQDLVHKAKKILWHSLSEADRRIMLIYADTASLRDTAKILHLSVGTVMKRIHKIQKIFRDLCY